MECEICHSTFNHTKKKPMSLYPCFHTFCSKCLDDWKEKTCPNCRLKIKDQNINWTVLKLVPEEDPCQARLKTELDQFLKDAENLKKEFDQMFSSKLKENKNKSNKLNDQINKKYNELLKVIQNNRTKLTDKIVNIEKQLNEKLNEINSSTSSSNFNFDTIRANLEEEDELDMYKMSQFKNELNIKTFQMKLKLEEMKKLDIVANHEFKLNETSYADINLIGELIVKNELLTTNFKFSQLLTPTVAPKEETLETNVDVRESNEFNEAQASPPTPSSVNNCMFSSAKHPEERKGIDFIKRQKFERALDCFDRLIANQPNYHRAYLWKSKVLFYLKRFPESDQFFNKTIELKPDCDEAFYCKGMSLIRLENFKDAEKCLDKAIEFSVLGDSWLAVNKVTDEVYCGKATCLLHLNNLAEALKYFDKAINLNPCNEKAYMGKGRTMNLMGQHNEAIRCFNKAIRLNPRNDKAYCGKSVSLQGLNKPDEALKCVNRAIDLNPLGFADFEKEQRQNTPKTL